MIATRGVRLELSSGTLESDPSILYQVRFGAERGAVAAATTTASIPMAVLGERNTEVWHAGEPVTRSTRDEFVLARSGDVLVGATAAHGSTGLRQRAAAIYNSAIAVARDEGFPHIVRMWNLFPEIHQSEEGLERYKAFCAGRSEGFQRSGLSVDDLPAASGVGTDGDGLIVTFLAARGNVRNVENPRQMSAFRYPEKYGPRSPSFARASIAEIAGERQLFVSGTASIVGCESVHEGNLDMQFRETVENLRAVCEVASDGRYATLAELPSAVYRAYVRHPEDYATLRSMFDDVAGPSAKSIWVRGDICRQELLIEIELWSRI